MCEDFRLLPNDWDDGIVRGRLDGMDRDVFLWVAPDGGYLCVPADVPGQEAWCRWSLRQAAWNALEMARLQAGDPDYSAWRERIAAALAKDENR